MKIKKNDKVLVVTGKDKGKRGEVLLVGKNNKIIVKGVNIVKKHIKPRKEGEKGQRIELENYIDASNVMYLCPSCSKAVRLGYKYITNENKGEKKDLKKLLKVRYCKKCKKEI